MGDDTGGVKPTAGDGTPITYHKQQYLKPFEFFKYTQEFITFKPTKAMKKFFKDLEWKFDYYFVIFLYNPNKAHRYDKYMTDKWGSRYTGTQ